MLTVSAHGVLLVVTVGTSWLGALVLLPLLLVV